MLTHGWVTAKPSRWVCHDPAMGQQSLVSSPVVLSSSEKVDGLVVCLSVSGVLSLFYQNKLGDVSPCGWMLWLFA
jgi:hypothetical protein